MSDNNRKEEQNISVPDTGAAKDPAKADIPADGSHKRTDSVSIPDRKNQKQDTNVSNALSDTAKSEERIDFMPDGSEKKEKEIEQFPPTPSKQEVNANPPLDYIWKQMQRINVDHEAASKTEENLPESRHLAKSEQQLDSFTESGSKQEQNIEIDQNGEKSELAVSPESQNEKQQQDIEEARIDTEKQEQDIVPHDIDPDAKQEVSVEETVLDNEKSLTAIEEATIDTAKQEQDIVTDDRQFKNQQDIIPLSFQRKEEVSVDEQEHHQKTEQDVEQQTIGTFKTEQNIDEEVTQLAKQFRDIIPPGLQVSKDGTEINFESIIQGVKDAVSNQKVIDIPVFISNKVQEIYGEAAANQPQSVNAKTENRVVNISSRDVDIDAINRNNLTPGPSIKAQRDIQTESVEPVKMTPDQVIASIVAEVSKKIQNRQQAQADFGPLARDLSGKAGSSLRETLDDSLPEYVEQEAVEPGNLFETDKITREPTFEVSASINREISMASNRTNVPPADRQIIGSGPNIKGEPLVVDILDRTNATPADIAFPFNDVGDRIDIQGTAVENRAVHAQNNLFSLGEAAKGKPTIDSERAIAYNILDINSPIAAIQRERNFNKTAADYVKATRGSMSGTELQDTDFIAHQIDHSAYTQQQGFITPGSQSPSGQQSVAGRSKDEINYDPAIVNRQVPDQSPLAQPLDVSSTVNLTSAAEGNRAETVNFNLGSAAAAKATTLLQDDKGIYYTFQSTGIDPESGELDSVHDPSILPGSQEPGIVLSALGPLKLNSPAVDVGIPVEAIKEDLQINVTGITDTEKAEQDVSGTIRGRQDRQDHTAISRTVIADRGMGFEKQVLSHAKLTVGGFNLAEGTVPSRTGAFGQFPYYDMYFAANQHIRPTPVDTDLLVKGISGQLQRDAGRLPKTSGEGTAETVTGRLVDVSEYKPIIITWRGKKLRGYGFLEIFHRGNDIDNIGTVGDVHYQTRNRRTRTGNSTQSATVRIPAKIPFQFTPEIGGDSRTANWNAITILGRSSSLYSYTGTSNRKLNITLHYLATEPPDGGSQHRTETSGVSRTEFVADAAADTVKSAIKKNFLAGSVQAASRLLADNKYQGMEDLIGWDEDIVYWAVNTLRALVLPQYRENNSAPPVVRLVYGDYYKKRMSIKDRNGDVQLVDIDPLFIVDSAEASFAGMQNPETKRYQKVQVSLSLIEIDEDIFTYESFYDLAGYIPKSVESVPSKSFAKSFTKSFFGQDLGGLINRKIL